MWWITYVLAPLVGGFLAMSGFIVKKAPDAQKVVNALTPYKAGLGVALLVAFIINCIDVLPHISDMFKISALVGLLIVLTLVSQVALGIMFGMALIAKWIPGESAAETKAVEMSKKLVSVEIPIGIIAIISAIGMLLFRLKPTLFI